MRSLEGEHLSYLFHKFDHVEHTRLNMGIRMKLMARVDFLMKIKKIDASDV